MEERYEHVVKVLTEHKDLLDYIAKRLEEIETMDGSEFYDIVKGEEHCKQLTADAGAEKAMGQEGASEPAQDDKSDK